MVETNFRCDFDDVTNMDAACIANHVYGEDENGNKFSINEGDKFNINCRRYIIDRVLNNKCFGYFGAQYTPLNELGVPVGIVVENRGTESISARNIFTDYMLLNSSN